MPKPTNLPKPAVTPNKPNTPAANTTRTTPNQQGTKKPATGGKGGHF